MCLRSQEVTDRESGMMVVEAVISFTAFIMVCLMITFMINIFVVHNRVQFAINSVAQELSSYGYIFDVTQALDGVRQIEADGKEDVSKIDDTAAKLAQALNDFNSLSDSASSAISGIENMELSMDGISDVIDQTKQVADDATQFGTSVKDTAVSAKNLFSDPSSLLSGIVYMAAEGAIYELSRLIGHGAAWAFTQKYLQDGDRSADEYLRSFGVINGYDGLNFDGSCFLGDEKHHMVDIVVSYDIDLSFVNFVLPNTKIHIVQRASAAAWVGGDGTSIKGA